MTELQSHTSIDPNDNRLKIHQMKRKQKRKLMKLKRSKFYRKELEQFVYDDVTLESKEWFLFNTSAKRKPYDEVLLTNVQITDSSNKEVDPNEVGIIDHMWVRIDKEWKRRNPFKTNDTLVLKGTLVEYMNQKKREKNIGLNVKSMKVIH